MDLNNFMIRVHFRKSPLPIVDAPETNLSWCYFICSNKHLIYTKQNKTKTPSKQFTKQVKCLKLLIYKSIYCSHSYFIHDVHGEVFLKRIKILLYM